MTITSRDAELVLYAVNQKVLEARTALHESAQRLTVLQGILELAALRNGSIEEFRLVSQTALREAQRLTAYFDELRRTVRSCTALLNQIECIAGGTLI